MHKNPIFLISKPFSSVARYKKNLNCKRYTMITTLNIHSRYDIETLARMVFKTQDVLNTEKERIRRSASLLKAAVLDSLAKVEVVLTLEDKDSQKKLRSRIIYSCYVVKNTMLVNRSEKQRYFPRNQTPFEQFKKWSFSQ